MSLHALLDWLSEFDPREEEAGLQLVYVEPALRDLSGQELDEEHQQVLRQLREAHARLARGEAAGDELEQFFVDFGHLREDHRPFADLLYSDLLSVARRLQRWQWNTRRYDDFRKLCEGGPGLDEFEQALEQSWSGYQATPVAAEEVAAESAVGHRLLQEAVELWKQAIESLRAGQSEEGLGFAQEGARLLVTIQRFSTRLERQVSRCAP